MRRSFSGITLIELLVVITVLSILLLATIESLDVVTQTKRRRDAKRFSDISVIYNAIELFNVDNEALPGDPGVLYTSENLIEDFWQEIGPYTRRLSFQDPINSGEFIYRYKHDGSSYELDSMVESIEGLMEAEKDGGNDDTRFEVGTDLSIL